MFEGAGKFNADISGWNVSAVTNMRKMFRHARAFNQNISKWNVNQTTGMGNMFEGAVSFNGDLSNWNVARVTDMDNMFNKAASFQGTNLAVWSGKIGAVKSMRNMFADAVAFRADISSWRPHEDCFLGSLMGNLLGIPSNNLGNHDNSNNLNNVNNQNNPSTNYKTGYGDAFTGYSHFQAAPPLGSNPIDLVVCERGSTLIQNAEAVASNADILPDNRIALTGYPDEINGKAEESQGVPPARLVQAIKLTHLIYAYVCTSVLKCMCRRR